MLSLFSPNRHRSGQNLLEYVVLITLVLGGIIIGGPYVIRSWYALLKGYDASVQDSYNDPLIQYPGSLPIPACDCTQWDGNPGSFKSVLPSYIGTCGEGGCEKRQYRQSKTCTPLGCERYTVPPTQTEKCAYHDFCCEDGVATGNCAEYAVNVLGVLGVGLRGCPEGQMEMLTHCGETSIPFYYCQPDELCVNRCQGTLPTDPVRYAGPCPGDLYGLNNDINYSFVNLFPPNGCTDGRKCEIQCNPPYVPTATECCDPSCTGRCGPICGGTIDCGPCGPFWTYIGIMTQFICEHCNQGCGSCTACWQGGCWENAFDCISTSYGYTVGVCILAECPSYPPTGPCTAGDVCYVKVGPPVPIYRCQ